MAKREENQLKLSLCGSKDLGMMVVESGNAGEAEAYRAAAKKDRDPCAWSCKWWSFGLSRLK